MAAGVVCSAAAQVLLKQASGSQTYGARWALWMAASVAAYAVAFVVYAAVLRQFPLTVAAPAMTIAVMCAVVVVGALLGEPLSTRQIIGVVFGITSVLAVLG